MKQRLNLIAALLILALFLTAFVLMSDAIQNSTRFGGLYSALFVVNSLGLLVLIYLIYIKILQLRKELKAKKPGSRLTLRMLIIILSLTITPVLVVYGFSLDFLRRGIDSWFDLRTEKALVDAMELSRSALDQHMRKLLSQTKLLGLEIAEGPSTTTPIDLSQLRDPTSTVVANSILPVDLDEFRERLGADELLLFTKKRKIIAASSSSNEILPNLPNTDLILRVNQGQNHIGLDLLNPTTLVARVVVNVPLIGSEKQFLQALYPISARQNKLAKSVESAYIKYKELSYLREQLKISFTMTLTLILLFSILSSVWAAFYSANLLTAPISDLAEGTRAVASGDYGRELPVTSQDEMGFLVDSFNQMTRKIATAQQEIRISHDHIETQRAYLQTVLGELSSGVLTLDHQLNLKTCNNSSDKILGIKLDQFIGKSITLISQEHPYLQPLIDTINHAHLDAETDWRQQIVIFGVSGRQVLMCRGTTLSSTQTVATGYVTVFDDITALIQGQRDAAWSEVARRLAHEIKNPLTPIQLSAERLRHKYHGLMQNKEGETLDRLTHTIIQQVETMKGMVNTFSDYARTPQMQPEPMNLNTLVEEVLDLYQSINREIKIDLQLDTELPTIQADVGRLRQVLNNLVKNAIEASDESNPIFLTIRTDNIHVNNHQFIELKIQDHGSGIPPHILQQIFEPYVSNKPKGTGLGLAIVKKIIEEHGGIVRLENVPEGGACAIIRLPVTTTLPESTVQPKRKIL